MKVWWWSVWCVCIDCHSDALHAHTRVAVDSLRQARCSSQSRGKNFSTWKLSNVEPEWNAAMMSGMKAMLVAFSLHGNEKPFLNVLEWWLWCVRGTKTNKKKREALNHVECFNGVRRLNSKPTNVDDFKNASRWFISRRLSFLECLHVCGAIFSGTIEAVIMDETATICIWSSLTAHNGWKQALKILVLQLHHSVDSPEAAWLRLRSLPNWFEYVLIDFHLMGNSGIFSH